MPKVIKETQVVKKVKDLFKNVFDTVDITKIHVTPLHNRGFPDLLIVTDGGVFFIEVKRPGNKPTKNQRAKLKILKAAGGDNVYCYWVDCAKNNTNLLRFKDPENDEVVCTISVKEHDPWQSRFLLTVQQLPETQETGELLQ